MKNRREIWALVPALVLLFVLAGCTGKGGNTAETAAAKGLPAMNTADQITLTYALWDDYEMTRALADKFTEKYPNIKIELIELALGGYMDALLAQASTGAFPDMFQFLSLSTTISNGWPLDITEYWENDPDTANYYSSLVPSNYVDGKRVFRFAAEYLPHVTYVDRAVFNRLNEPMPAFNWTYEQAMDLAKKMTRPDQGVYGFNYMGGAGPVTLAPIALTDGLSEFGWDGENYHMAGPWAEAINFTAEARRLGYQALQGTEAWGAVSGDPNMWPGESGRVAFQMDAWWTLNNIYTKASAIERGIDMIPYVQPRGANAKTNRKDAAVDYAAISSATKYPREAYEALKFLTWSKEGWTERIKLFPALVNEAGTKIYDVPNCFPLLNDDELYAEFRRLFDPVCQGDTFKAEAYDQFMQLCREPVPLGGQGILGFDLWLTEIYFGQDWNGVINVEEAIFAGAINANDAAPELEKTGREYYLRALDEFKAIYP